jgi:hypothetical protein
MHWPTYLVLLSVVLINSIWCTALMVPYAINHHGHIAVYYALVYGAAAFGLGFLGAASLGLVGVALVLLITEVSMTGIVLRASFRMTGVRAAQWAETVLHPPVGTFGQVALIMRKRMNVTSEGLADSKHSN